MINYKQKQSLLSDQSKYYFIALQKVFGDISSLDVLNLKKKGEKRKKEKNKKIVRIHEYSSK